MCVACGDNGSTDGVTDGHDHVDFPASSPYSLACGGTKLTLRAAQSRAKLSGTICPMTAQPAAASAGPFRCRHGRPKQMFRHRPTGSAGRGVPDVAGDADPHWVHGEGGWLVFAVGGTSAVAPLWAGLFALFNQSLSKPVGYLNPTLYQSVASVSGTFRDITSGNNGDYKAGPGWDACTGWGSPNGTNLLTALSGGTPAPTPHAAPHSNADSSSQAETEAQAEAKAEAEAQAKAEAKTEEVVEVEERCPRFYSAFPDLVCPGRAALQRLLRNSVRCCIGGTNHRKTERPWRVHDSPARSRRSECWGQVEEFLRVPRGRQSFVTASSAPR